MRGLTIRHVAASAAINTATANGVTTSLKYGQLTKKRYNSASAAIVAAHTLTSAGILVRSRLIKLGAVEVALISRPPKRGRKTLS